jgi:hypothetical protein
MVMVYKTDDQIDEDRYCKSTPIGEKWPICNLYVNHPAEWHESADYKWKTDGPAIMKGTNG